MINVSLQPDFYRDADQDSILVEAPSGDLYELVDGQFVPAREEYPYLEFENRHFYLHGHNISTAENDHAVVVRHKQNGCTDCFRYTVYDIQVRFFHYTSEQRVERVYYPPADLPNFINVPVLYDYGRTSFLPEEWHGYRGGADGYTNLDVVDLTWECPVFWINIWNQVQLRNQYRNSLSFSGSCYRFTFFYSPHVPDGISSRVESVDFDPRDTPDRTQVFGQIAHYHEWGHLAACHKLIQQGLGLWIQAEVDKKTAKDTFHARYAYSAALEKPYGASLPREFPLTPIQATATRGTVIAGGGDHGTMRYFTNGTMRSGWSFDSTAGECPVKLIYEPPFLSRSDLQKDYEKEEKKEYPRDSNSLGLSSELDPEHTLSETLP